jgi:hypothetical protein
MAQISFGFIGYSIYNLATEPSWTNAAALGGDILGAAIPFVTGVGTGIRAAAHADDAIDAVRGVSGASDAAKSGLRRPYIRNSTRDAVEARAPRDAAGRPLDPNTGRPIDGRPDLGHKTGNEFRREKARAESEGLTQKEFNDRMNNPDLYQLESPSTNRSRIYEQKP